jgi:hypothetical protein
MAAPGLARVILRALPTVFVVFFAVTSASAVPGPPANLVAQVAQSTVTFTWTAPGGPIIGYVLEAGSGSGLSNLARLVVGPTPSFSAIGVPPGTYFVRIRAIDADGQGAPSNEVVVTVTGGGCTAPPNPPVLTAAVSGRSVNLTWSSGGCPTSNFALHAGSSPGSSNLAIANMGVRTSFSATVPAGTYYLRVFAQNAFGSSAASNEAIAQVAAGSVPNVTGTWRLTRSGTNSFISQFSTFTVTLLQSGTAISGTIQPAGRPAQTLHSSSRVLPDGRVRFGTESLSNSWNDFEDAYFTMTVDATQTQMTGTCNFTFTCTSATAVKIR